jgi:hypothetical protein
MCAKGFRSRILSAQGKLYCPERLNEILNKVLTGWKNNRYVDKLLARIKTYAVNLSERFYAHPGLPELIIHGDYYGQNLIFRDRKIVGVVDYDKASWQPRVAELAEALIFFSSTARGTFKHLVYPGFISWKRFSKFLRHYASAFTAAGRCFPRAVQSQEEPITPLQPNELQVLPDYINCIWLTVSLQRLLEKDDALTDFAEALNEVLALADWSAKNAQRMINTSLNALKEK